MPSNFKALAGASGGEPTDPNFKNVTLLLHGDGSNGAQNNTFLDSSTNNFTITRNGNTTQGSFSPYGSNWSNFNPNSDNGIGVASNAALNMGTGDFTVEAWVNTAQLPTTNSFQTSPGGFQAVFGTGPNLAGTGSQLYIGVTNLKFDIASDGGGPIDVAHNMVAGQWYHVAITRSGTTFRAFINGVLVQTATGISTSWVDGYGWGIMRAEPIGGYGGAWWYGYVSNLRVVKGTAVYTAAFTPSTTPLTAITNTSLLTCQSNRFRDASTNNFTITRNGDVKVTNFAPFAPSSAYSASTNGGSGYFDGTGDYLTSTSANTANAMGTGDWTVEGWVYRTSGAADMVIFDTVGVGATTADYIRIFINTGGGVSFWKYSTATTTSTSAIPIGAWGHFAVVRESGSIKIYVNGVQGNTTYTDTGSNYTCSTSRPAVGINGYDAAANAYAGYVSNIRAVKGTAVYTANFTPPTSPVTAITNTSLLLNATNAAIFDNSMKNDLETVGNAQISTSVKKFGTGSMAFGNATTDALFAPTPNSMDISSGDFTMEFWVNFNGFGSDKKYAIQISGSSYWQLVHDSSFGISLRVTGYSEIVGQGSNTGWSTGTWYHVALVRSGNTFTIYRNGTSIATATNSSSLGFYPNMYIGGYGSTNSLNAYVDDFRITKGIARYTANFTPPTAAFPNK
jgi:hypothetical protein